MPQGDDNALVDPIQPLNECLPDDREFIPVIGMGEYHGRFCLVQWKNSKTVTELDDIEKTMIERLARSGHFAIFVVYGDAETGEASHVVSINHKREWRTNQDKDIEWLKGQIRRWADWAKENPTFNGYKAQDAKAEG